jgi:hypothetical protein
MHNLKRRRARERGNITGFVTEVGRFTDTTALEDYEYYQDRLREALGQLTSLDDEIHELIDDSEYDVDVQKCEEYIESAKRAILRTLRQMEKLLALSTANVTISDARDCSIGHDKVTLDQARAIFCRYRDMGTLLGAVYAVNRQRPVAVNKQ